MIADIEARAWSAGVSINALCKRAGVHPTTFSRWKKSERNPEPITPHLRSLTKLYAALDAIEAGCRRRRRLRAAA